MWWWKVVDYGNDVVAFGNQNNKNHYNKFERKEGEVMSLGLKGEYNHTVDDKGRMIVPSKLREQLGLSFVVTKGMDRCLYAYPNNEWEIFENKLRQLPTTNPKARQFVRVFLGSAVDCEVDNQGRINIPKTLRDYAEITKDVTVVGVGDKAEIWSKDKLDAMSNSDEFNLDDLASGFEDLGFNI